MKYGLREQNAFEAVWWKRDLVVQCMFDKINAFLKTPRGQNINTDFYDTLCLQWLEFAALSPRQVAVLEDIVERFKL